MKLIVPIYYTIEKKTKENKTILVNMNWYRNAHYMLSNKVKQHYHDLVREQYNGEEFTCISPKYMVYSKRTGTDGANIRAIIEKFVLDGLVKVGAITDDTIKYVIGDNSEYFIDKENPRAVITIEEVSRNRENK